MLKTIKGIYNNGTIELLEMPTEIYSQTDVLVTFFVQEIFGGDNIEYRIVYNLSDSIV